MLEKHKDFSPAGIAKAALQAFYNLSTIWNLSVDQEKILLGSPEENVFMDWKTGESDVLVDDEVLMRISHLINIHKNLCTLLPTDKAANGWVHRPNSYDLFNDDTALNFMLHGQLSAIEQVHEYLDDEILGVIRIKN